MKEDVFEEEKELISARMKSLKKGNNVIHLSYIGVYNDSDLKEFSEKLLTANLELSSFNASRITVNSFDDYNFVTYLAISQPLILEFLKGISTNAAWDVTKQVIISARNKILGKKYYKVTANSSEEKEITFGVKVSLDKNTGFDFELRGDISDEVINESLDKILDLLKTKKTNQEYEHPIYLKYSKKEKKWIEINVLEEIRKKNKNKK